jgi:hypothetical protein
LQRERNTYRCAEGKKYIQMCRGKDRMTSVLFAFRNFANSPKK